MLFLIMHFWKNMMQLFLLNAKTQKWQNVKDNIVFLRFKCGICGRDFHYFTISIEYLWFNLTNLKRSLFEKKSHQMSFWVAWHETRWQYWNINVIFRYIGIHFIFKIDTFRGNFVAPAFKSDPAPFIHLH